MARTTHNVQKTPAQRTADKETKKIAKKDERNREKQHVKKLTDKATGDKE